MEVFNHLNCCSIRNIRKEWDSRDDDGESGRGRRALLVAFSNTLMVDVMTTCLSHTLLTNRRFNLVELNVVTANTSSTAKNTNE